MTKIKVAICGLGPIGLEIARQVHQHSNLTLVALVDINPNLIGKSGNDLLASLPSSIIISDRLTQTLIKTKADIAIVCTTSSLKLMKDTITEIAEAGVSVISTCEELLNPWQTQAALAEKINEIAMKNQVKVLGTGINPGFLMDTLPAILTAGCESVKSIQITRQFDASKRRLPFQKKVGVGLELKDFQAAVLDQKIRHVGLAESMHLLASALGWTLTSTTDDVFPVEENGKALGVRQVGVGYIKDKKVIELVFKASKGEADPKDEIVINGTPSIKMTVANGYPGDISTACVMVNSIRPLLSDDVKPGLKTMIEIPIPSCYHYKHE
mgnify:CR=1 FL=1